MQLARIYGHLEGSIEDGGLTIHHDSVQKQEGTKDCGVYSIAFAYHAALGKNLEEITFDKDKLRSHLVTCFQNNCLSKFPICSQNFQGLASHQFHSSVCIVIVNCRNHLTM